MNRTALSVVALAVGSILILGLYNIYKPQTNSMVHDVFNKVHMSRMAGEKVSPEDQAKDHGIDINNPKRPKDVYPFYVEMDKYTAGSTHPLQYYHYFKWNWHKQVKNGYIGYWSADETNVEMGQVASDAEFVGNEYYEPKNVKSYEKPDGTVTDWLDMVN